MNPAWLSVQMCDYSGISFWLAWQRMGWWWDKGADLVLFRCICWELGASWEHEIPKLGLELRSLAQNRISCSAARPYILEHLPGTDFFSVFRRDQWYLERCAGHTKFTPFLHQWFYTADSFLCPKDSEITMKGKWKQDRELITCLLKMFHSMKKH